MNTGKNAVQLPKMMTGMYRMELAPLLRCEWTKGEMRSHRLCAELLSTFTQQPIHFFERRPDLTHKLRAAQLP